MELWFAAALIYDVPNEYTPDDKEIRIAFDGDAVIFSEQSEAIYKTKGLQAFLDIGRKKHYGGVTTNY